MFRPRPLLEVLFGRLVRLDGPLVPFSEGPGATPAVPVPTAAPATASGPAAADSPGSIPGDVGAASTDRQEAGQGVGFPQAHTPSRPGAGRVADNCLFWLDDPRHECLNSYGEPVRPGQSCYPSARAESLRSYSVEHPDSWITKALTHDIPKEAAR